jgi:hypothetical protein
MTPTEDVGTDELLELAERCEQATGPDAALDYDILCVADPRALRTGKLPGDPRYTASLDAAMTLVRDSDVWGVSKQERNPNADYYYQASVMPFGPRPWGEAIGNTAPLALCAAALRSRAATREDER